MTTKKMTRRQARWVETMGFFEFEMVFCPGRHSSKPDALSCWPNLIPAKEEQMTFGQLLKPSNITNKTFAEIMEFKEYFIDESMEFANMEFWF